MNLTLEDNGGMLASGAYLYRLQMGRGVSSRALVLLK